MIPSKNFAVFLFTITILIGLSSFKVHAQTTANTSPANKQETAEAARCKNLTDKIDNKVTQFENNKKGYIQRYENLQSQLVTLLTKLKAKGYDVTLFQKDTETLNQKIKKLGTDYNTYIEKLKGTKTYTCGKSQGAFAAEIKNARDALQVVRADILDIKTFYESTLKPDLQFIRSQKVKVEGKQ